MNSSIGWYSKIATGVAPRVNRVLYLDFSDYDHDLLALPNSYKNVASLPGEALEHTSVIQHTIHLSSGSNPFYTPSYQVLHSRQVVFENAVQGVLNQVVIELNYLSSNATLILVSKKNKVTTVSLWDSGI